MNVSARPDGIAERCPLELRAAALPPLSPVVLSSAPHKPEPLSILLGMRILGTPPSVYCASIIPLEPTAHCLHVRILIQGSISARKRSTREKHTWSMPSTRRMGFWLRYGCHFWAVKTIRIGIRMSREKRKTWPTGDPILVTTEITGPFMMASP